MWCALEPFVVAHGDGLLFNALLQNQLIATLVCLCSLSAGVATAQTPLPKTPTTLHDVINPDRPGIADGSAVIGRGRVQLEVGLQQEFRSLDSGADHSHFVPTLLRVGLSSRWEARFESNTFTQTRGADPEGDAITTSGFAPVSFGIKFQMQDSAGPRHPSVGTILRVFPASGTAGFQTDRVTADLRLAADWDLTPRISLNPNAGLAVYEDDENRRFAAGLFALTLNYFNHAKTMNPFVDVGIQKPETSAAGSSIIVDGGFAYLPGRNVQIDVSAGVGSRGRTPPRRFFSLGLSIRFRAAGA